MSKYFITGGSGFLGSHLIKMLSEQGETVIALERKPGSVILGKNVQIVSGDLKDTSAFSKSLNGVDYLINLAGVVTDWAPRDLYFETHVHGLERLVLSAIEARVKRIVSISSIDALKKTHNIVLRNDGEPNNTNLPYNKSKAEAEAMLVGYQDKIEVVILRPSWIFGPGDKTFFPELAFQLFKGEMVYLGNKKNLIPLVFVDNLCHAIIDASRAPGINGKNLIISDGEIAFDELCNRIVNKLGGKMPKITIPYSVAYNLGYLFEAFATLIKSKNRPLLTRTAVEQLGKSLKVDNSDSIKLIKYKTIVPLELALNQTLDWLSQLNISNYRQK